MPKVKYPLMYKTLGGRLKKFRLLRRQKINEVSLAVDIDRTYISKIENGHVKPSLEVLDKLVKHYFIPGPESQEIYSLAGYGDNHIIVDEQKREEVFKMEDKQIPTADKTAGVEISVPNDKAILYSDSVFLTSNQFGIVFDYAQRMGNTNKHIVVSRIGMSKTHAQVLLKVLEEHLKKDETPNIVKKAES